MSQTVREAIDAANRAFVETFVRGDAPAAAKFYTEDAKLIAPGAAVAHGRAAITNALQAMIDTHFKAVMQDTGLVESVGDLAFEDGIVKFVGANDEVTEVRYVLVWKKVNGEWKYHRDIFN
jgi:uncharacterized protein (TIGR02246 family)